jgi:hypothetical protein
MTRLLGFLVVAVAAVFVALLRFGKAASENGQRYLLSTEGNNE